MKNIFAEIIEHKFNEIDGKKQKFPLTDLIKQIMNKREKKRDFIGSIINPKAGDISIITEIKLASPTEGKLGEKKEIVKRAVLYEKSSADAISLIVDKKYFNGEIDFVKQIKSVISLPVLAKDFIIDPYQIYEMKFYGADAILLIAKILFKKQLKEFVNLALELGLEPVVEVQNKKELDRAFDTDTRSIAVNARDLSSFHVNIERACALMRLIPKGIMALGFSGVKDRNDVEKYKDAGAAGVLVGTSLMKSNNIKEFLMSLRGARLPHSFHSFAMTNNIMKCKVKICGIRSLVDADISISAGADFLGFNFVVNSKRFIKPEMAKGILEKIDRDRHSASWRIAMTGKFKLKKKIKIVGVFRDEKIEKIKELISFLELDYVQLHGSESPEYISLVDGAKIIRTFSLDADFDVEETINKMRKYGADYFLLDRKMQGRGELLNSDKVRQLTAVFPIILAGGLTIENVAEVVQLARPQVVDVAAGVVTDGVKDKN